MSDALQIGSRSYIATHAVTWLFVPGDRPERFTKAVAAGSDAIIIDLEDAVDDASKVKARDMVEGFLGSSTAELFIRINGENTEFFADDVAMLERATAHEGHGLLGIVLPKAENVECIESLRLRFPVEVALIAIVESAIGMQNVHHLAASPALDRLAFGAVDYSVELELGPEPRALDHARSVLVLASKVAGLPAPIDAPSLTISDSAQLSLEAELGRSFGFGGKLCIHPIQLKHVAAAYNPSEQELAWAQRVVRVAATGAAKLDGKMIDRPVIEQARKLLTRAENLSEDGASN